MTCKCVCVDKHKTVERPVCVVYAEFTMSGRLSLTVPWGLKREGLGFDGAWSLQEFDGTCSKEE